MKRGSFSRKPAALLLGLRAGVRCGVCCCVSPCVSRKTPRKCGALAVSFGLSIALYPKDERGSSYRALTTNSDAAVRCSHPSAQLRMQEYAAPQMAGLDVAEVIVLAAKMSG